jgi:hypothetical protein
MPTFQPGSNDGYTCGATRRMILLRVKWHIKPQCHLSFFHNLNNRKAFCHEKKTSGKFPGGMNLPVQRQQSTSRLATCHPQMLPFEPCRRMRAWFKSRHLGVTPSACPGCGSAAAILQRLAAYLVATSWRAAGVVLQCWYVVGARDT